MGSVKEKDAGARRLLPIQYEIPPHLIRAPRVLKTAGLGRNYTTDVDVKQDKKAQFLMIWLH